jgi:hypothetical protein
MSPVSMALITWGFGGLVRCGEVKGGLGGGEIAMGWLLIGGLDGWLDGWLLW